MSMDTEFLECKPLHDAFWEVVDTMSLEEKRRFVKFITGTDKLPIPKSEV